MRRFHLFASCVVLLLASSAAFAVDHTVTARNGPGGRHFDPAALEIAPGDTVTFVNDPADPGFHNAASDTGAITVFRCANGCDGTGGNGDPSGALWTGTVTLPTAGIVAYHCEVHGADGGLGMSGTITVNAVAPSAVIGVAPTALSDTAESGAVALVAFQISNAGDADLAWNADTADTDCTLPGSVPWIVLAPPSGSVAVGAPAQNVDVTLDASSLVAGIYNANICIHSNDAANDPVTLPVEFTVTIPDLVFADGFDG